jgi:hypothetical protein
MYLFLQIWESLVQPNKEIKKAKGDFKVRQGVTQEPLADVEFVGKFLDKLL